MGRGRGEFLKRLFDALLSAAALIVSSPLWLLIALAIRWEDGGPLFYAQERVEKGGRLFRAYKFRAMVRDAEEATGPVQASYGVPRSTRIGRLPRATPWMSCHSCGAS